MTTLLDGYITRDQLATDFGVTPRTVLRYENEPNGLPFLEVGGRKLYRPDSVRSWLAGRERQRNPRRRTA